MGAETVFIGIGGLAATNQPGMCIKTMALGSCVSIVMLDSRTRTVAMAHVALPDSKISPERARENPGHFADTAVPALLQEMQKYGAQTDLSSRKRIMVKITGGAQVVDPNNVFNIGKRNVMAIKKVLWEHGMGVIAENVGGTHSRTVSVDVDTGTIAIMSPGRDQENL